MPMRSRRAVRVYIQKADELSVEMRELCDEVGFVYYLITDAPAGSTELAPPLIYYLIIARLYDLDPKLNKNERTFRLYKHMHAAPCAARPARPVVKLLSKTWWIPRGASPEGQKLEPEGPRAEVGFPTADQGFSSIRRTLSGFYGI